jgi:hypothetical protein
VPQGGYQFIRADALVTLVFQPLHLPFKILACDGQFAEQGVGIGRQGVDVVVHQDRNVRDTLDLIPLVAVRACRDDVDQYETEGKAPEAGFPDHDRPVLMAKRRQSKY